MVPIVGLPSRYVIDRVRFGLEVEHRPVQVGAQQRRIRRPLGTGQHRSGGPVAVDQETVGISANGAMASNVARRTPAAYPISPPPCSGRTWPGVSTQTQPRNAITRAV